MRILVAVLILAGLLGVSSPASAAPPPVDASTFERIDAFLRDEQRDAGIPGLAVAIVVGDRVAHVTTLGVANDARQPVTADTPFLLASVSKAFAALSVMQLVERGHIELDAPVQRYVGSFRVADEQASAEITIRQLLHHTAGLDERRPGNDQDPAALERFVSGLSTMELVNQPGEAYNYTNASYNVLAHVVETVGGMPYDQYLEQNIYEPLGMTHSHALAADALADGAGHGFYRWFGAWTAETPLDAPRAEAASATTWSSINDMARWLIAHLRGGAYGDARILSEAGMQALHTPYAAADEFHGYGMGWLVRPLWEEVEVEGAQEFDFPALVEHGGGWPTGHTYAAIVPERDWGFVLLTNVHDETNGPRYWAVEQGILRILSGKEPVGGEGGVPPLVAYGKQLAVVLLVLELTSFAWAVSRIRRWRRSGAASPRGSRLALAVLAPLALDGLVLWLFFVDGPANGVDLDSIFRWGPDVAIVAVPLLILAALWGLVRTVLFLAPPFFRRRGPADVAGEPDVPTARPLPAGS